MVQPSLEAIREQHETLLSKSAAMRKENIPQAEELVKEVEEYVESVAKAGGYIEDTRQRSFLRALIDYWESFINDKTGNFPPFARLQPFGLSLGKSFLRKLIENPSFVSIDNDKRFRNLAKGYWVYDELLRGLASNGWVRFAPGYKGALYGKKSSKWCIKVLGMGVGEDPLFFCEHGEYVEHERRMLEAFKREGFDFQPDVKSQEETIQFLVEECGVSQQQAEWRALRNDVLVMQYIRGTPFATQTGYDVDYDLDITIMDESTLREMHAALTVLKERLDCAHRKNLVHNDAVPPNIIFTLDEEDKIVAKLVDFETAQDLNMPSPDFVTNTVCDLYRERRVSVDNTGKYTKTLDQHLIDEDLAILDKLIQTVNSQASIKLAFSDRKLSIAF